MVNITGRLKNSYQLQSSSSANKSMLVRANSEPIPESNSALESSANVLPSPSAACDQAEEESVRRRRMLSTDIEKYSHMLVGKVRDTNMLFSFIVEASIIEVDQSSVGPVAQ